MNEPNEIEVFYRGMAMLGLVIQGVDEEDIPEIAKRLANHMMDNPKAAGIVAVKPKKYTRK